MSSACLILAPEIDPPTLNRKQTKAWETKLSSVIHYRGCYQDIPGKEGSLCYLANQGELDGFSIGQFPDSDELGSIEKLAAVYPGHYLVAWTYGGVLTVWTLKKLDVGDPETAEFSFRLDCPAPLRQIDKTEKLIESLAQSPFSGNSEALRDELNRDSISVKGFFNALGIPGAAELANEEGPELWNEFEEAAAALLQGGDIPDVSRINRTLEQGDEENLLPEEKPDQPGAMARAIFYARSELAELIGEPETDLWKSRITAASFYWDITDSEESCERLTFGRGVNGQGHAAAIGRLLGHYPKELMRDGIFLAEAALEAESANGHSYVGALSLLAECCHQSGFTLVIFPSDSQIAFRDRFGIEEYEDHHQISAEWCAEAFIDIEGLEKTESPDNFSDWMTEQGCDGIVIRANPNGSFTCTRAGTSLPEKPLDENAIEEAARALWPRDIFPALGLPDLLEPGEWHPGAYSGWAPGEKEKFEADMQIKSEAALKIVRAGSEPKRVPDFRVLQEAFPQGIYRAGCDSGTDEEIFFELILPKGNRSSLADGLVSDLKGSGLIDDYGNAWTDGNGSVVAYSRSDLSTSLFCRTLTDLPNRTVLNLYTVDEKPFRYIIDSEAEKAYFSTALLLADRQENDSEEEDEEWSDEYLAELAEFEEEFAAFGLDFSPLFPKKPMICEIEPDSDLIDDVIHEDGDTTYFSLDLSEEEIKKPEELIRWEAELNQLGFDLMGDLLCSNFNNVIMRCFGREDQAAYGVIMIPMMGKFTCEFYTAFEGGMSVTTTTNQSSHERLDAGAFVQKYAEDTSAINLYKYHMEKVEALLKERRIASKAEPTLAANAKAIHEFLSRVFGAIL